jgi:hypothetical protein
MLTTETSGDNELAIPGWPEIDPLEYDDNSANQVEISGISVQKEGDTSPYGDWE